jgi:hypothetical protein
VIPLGRELDDQGPDGRAAMGGEGQTPEDSVTLGRAPMYHRRGHNKGVKIHPALMGTYLDGEGCGVL